MTKFEDKKFGTPANSKAYTDNYGRVFESTDDEPPLDAATRLAEEFDFMQDVECGVRIPEEWYTYVRGLCLLIEERVEWECVSITVHQVKDKFGGLRFYHTVYGAREDKAYVQGLVDMTAMAVVMAEEDIDEQCR